MDKDLKKQNITISEPNKSDTNSENKTSNKRQIGSEFIDEI